MPPNAVKDGEVTRVAIKEISDRLGLNWSGQFLRLNYAMQRCPGDDQARDLADDISAAR